LVQEADAGVMKDAPRPAAVMVATTRCRTRWVRSLAKAPDRDRLAQLAWTDEGHLHDPGALIEIDPAGTAPPQ
jgi:hypothetical protein